MSARRHGERGCAPDGLGAAAVLEGLDSDLFGRGYFHFLRSIGSTNDHAARLAGRGCPQGTVVMADRQTRGRGQRGRRWFSPPGAGVYLSLVLRPPLTPAQAPKITLLAAVAAAEALIDTAGLEARIKWPNDVLVGGRKIAGILCQMDAAGDRVAHVIVGAGINVNTPAGILPGDIGVTATSVLMETGAPASRTAVARAFLRRLERHYSASLDDGFAAVLARWRELSCLTGREVRVDGTEGPVRGVVVGIDEEGALVLRDRGGALRRIPSGEIITV